MISVKQAAALRVHLGLTQKEVADVIGISHATVSYIERGRGKKGRSIKSYRLFMTELHEANEVDATKSAARRHETPTKPISAPKAKPMFTVRPNDRGITIKFPKGLSVTIEQQEDQL